MEAEDVINLFDSYWFDQDFFRKTLENPTSSTFTKIPDHQFQNHQDLSKLPEISTQLTLHTRSKSEQTISPKASINIGAFSPDSVLPAPHLETILSGIEGEAAGYQLQTTHKTRRGFKTDEKKKKEKRIPRKKGLSKSLSELEFEEIKGFMDLGFVFSEEDQKDSTLVEIIPGLQRLGKERNGEKEEKKGSVNDAEQPSSTVIARRPYLSEAWEVLDRKNEGNPLMTWKVPQEKNETVMKDTLKRWAHIVASTV